MSWFGEQVSHPGRAQPPMQLKSDSYGNTGRIWSQSSQRASGGLVIASPTRQFTISLQHQLTIRFNFLAPVAVIAVWAHEFVVVGAFESLAGTATSASGER